MADLKHWLLQLLIAIDQLLNMLITPGSRNAWADETLSSRIWRLHLRGDWLGKLLHPVINTLIFWQPDHCRKAFESERAGRQLPPEARNAQEQT